MKAHVYWLAATSLVLTLLLIIWGAASLVMGQGWPFHRVWGGLFVLLGCALTVAATRWPQHFWRVFWRPRTEQDPAPPPVVRRVYLYVLAAGLASGGTAYALTGELWTLIGGFAVVLLAWRVLG